MSRLRDDSGLTLVEMLVSMTIMTIVLGATLGVLEMMQRQNADATVRVDTRDQLRTTLDRMIKPLRAAVETPVGMVEFNGPNDLVYDAIGPTAPTGSNVPNAAALQRVRVCVDTTNQRIYRQTFAFATKDPPLLASPAPACGQGVPTSYDNAQVIGTNVTNDSTKPLFSYDFPTGSTALKDLQGIKVSLYVDANGATKPPGEARLTTSIAMRNVNQAPVADFTFATVNGHALLNASTSFDPDGGSLDYQWEADTNPGQVLGTDMRYDQGGLLPGQSVAFTLTVTDPSKLSTQITKTVTMPVPTP